MMVDRITTSFEPLMVTIKEASRRTGCSYDFIRKLCIRNQIVYVKAGSKYLINYPKFIEYLNTGSNAEKDSEKDA